MRVIIDGRKATLVPAENDWLRVVYDDSDPVKRGAYPHAHFVSPSYAKKLMEIS